MLPLTTRKAKNLESTKFTHMRPAMPQATASVTSQTTMGQGLVSITRIRLLACKAQTPSICSTVHVAKPGGGRKGILRGPVPLHCCSEGSSCHLTQPAWVFWCTEHWLLLLEGRRCKGVVPGWWDVVGGVGCCRSWSMAWSLPHGPSTVLQESEAPSQQGGAIEEIGQPLSSWWETKAEQGQLQLSVATLMENSIKNEVSHCPVLQQDEAENRAEVVRREGKPDLWDMEEYSNQGLKVRSNSFL